MLALALVLVAVSFFGAAFVALFLSAEVFLAAGVLVFAVAAFCYKSDNRHHAELADQHTLAADLGAAFFSAAGAFSFFSAAAFSAFLL